MYSMFCKVLYGQVWSDLMIWSDLILAVRRPSGGRPAFLLLIVYMDYQFNRLSVRRPSGQFWPSGGRPAAVRRPSGFGRPAPDGHTKEPGRPPDGFGRRWTALDG